jgi:ankyrin repeat protein
MNKSRLIEFQREIVEVLLAQGFDIFEREIVEMLLAQGADINAKSSNAETLLDSTAPSGSDAVAEPLPAHDADVNVSGSIGNSSLHAATPNKRSQARPRRGSARHATLP